MDFIKAQLFLDKINREMSRMQASPTQVAQIDIDILKNYIRELYDVCNDDSKTHQFAPRQEKQVAPAGPKTLPVTEDVKRPEPVRFSPERAPIMVKPTPVEVIPGPVKVPQPTPEPVKPVVVEVQAVEPEPTPAPPPVQAAPKSTGVVSKKVAALFVLPEAKEISERLSRSPLTDIKKGMTLNDRLQLPSALFGGDQGAFDEAIDRVNRAASFEDAKDYLQGIAEKNDWSHASKEHVAQSFVVLVGRRFSL